MILQFSARMPIPAIVSLSRLRRMTIFALDTGQKLGNVMDAIVCLARGQLLGIVLRTPEGNDLALSTRDFIISNGFIFGEDAALCEIEMLRTKHGSDVCNCTELLGATVVTNGGDWVGRIVEIHISVERARMVYRVVKSQFRAILGGGFFMPGNASRAYSRAQARMIVPEDTVKRYTATSPFDAIWPEF
jgi:sporulation protein YlmC with PRC-barrel domain